MSWIRKIPYAEATGKLLRLYDRIKGPEGYLDNILTVHGQRPHSLEGHMGLYKNVLHHRENRTPKWELEMLGVYASHLNGCAYCVEHHFEGMRTLLRDDARAGAIRTALEGGSLESTALESTAFNAVFTAREIALLAYTRKLTEAPASVTEDDVRALQAQGLSEGEVLEVNQVVSYFAYANRTVLGLGVTTDGDVLGLSPADSDDPDNWRHDEAKS